MKIRTRFSPSPTGLLHLGNARAALFGALYAVKNHGAFILRIEDTDVTRSQNQYVELLQDDLHWLGIAWQEGPGVGGEYGPYWQSQRQAIYEKYYKILEENKLIYPCFCTDQELMLARKLQLSRGQAPRYQGTCKQLSAEAIAGKIAEGKKPAWRFTVPTNKVVEFTDVVKGPQKFQSDDIGDFVVRRADGTGPFLYSNAIDDATMEISHVLRGEDHLANTPRQIMLLQTLGLHVPQYGHLSLIVGDDGAPLSKRHGSFSLQDLREHGYLPLAVMNYLARLGHATEAQEMLALDKLAEHFYLEKLSRSSARFDKTQLLYWQKNAVQLLDETSFRRWVGEGIMQQVPQQHQQLFIDCMRANIVFPKEANVWAKIFFHENVEIDNAEKQIIHEAGEQFFVEAELAVDKFGIDLPQVLAEMKRTLNVSGKKLFMPLRVSLTGKIHGPELAVIAQLLGPKKLKHRLSNAFKLAE